MDPILPARKWNSIMTGNNMQMCNLQIKFITLLKYKMVENNTSDLTRIGLPNKVHAPSNLYQNNFIFSLCYFPIDNGAMIFLFPCIIVVLCLLALNRWIIYGRYRPWDVLVLTPIYYSCLKYYCKYHLNPIQHYSV